MKRLRLLPFCLFLAGLVSGCGGGTAHPTFPGAPVVLISIDTLRADHLSAYGYSGVQTPAIDALRRDAILYENAYAHGPLTLPSHVSIFTGLLPTQHGVRDNLGYGLDAKAHPTLAALLKERGYATGAAVSAFVLRRGTGLGDGFDFYEDAIERTRDSDALGLAQRPGGEAARRLEEWGAAQAAGKPFFLFLHLYEPHAPYEPPAPFDGRYASAYDGEVAAADAIVGEFLERLRQAGLYDRSIVMLLSDHGEGLLEHGERHHGILLYRWALHVPLILKLPGSARAGTSVRAPVALVDIVPTLTRLLGLRAPEGLTGQSLLDAPRLGRRIYAETYYPRIRLGWSDLRSLVDERYQLMEGPRPELYDITADPRQLHDLVDREGKAVERMRAELGRYPRGLEAPQAVDPGVRERLAALGYLTGGPSTESAGPLPNPRDHIHEIEAVEEAFRLTKGRDEEAVPAFRRLLASNPRQLDVQLGLAQSLARLERYAEAAAAYESAIRMAPAMAGEIALILARVQLLRGRFADVAATARLGLSTSPAQARELLAWAALGRGDLDAAEREARQAQGEASAEMGSALALAEVHVRRSRFTEALAVLDQARARWPRAAVRGLELARGDALARLGRHAEAEAAFKKEIAAFPLNTEAHARLAIVYALQGRTKADVGEVFEAMYAASPRRETALLAARTLASLGDAPRATLWRQRAAASRP